jgi:hypothetical protein
MVRKAVMTLTGLAALLAGAVTLAAPAQDRPGVMTQGRVFIENRSPAEAIPVSIEMIRLDRPMIVQFDNAATISARVARQSWEYDSVTIRGNDFRSALAKAGSEGWEVIAIQPLPPDTDKTPMASALLKRPR